MLHWALTPTPMPVFMSDADWLSASPHGSLLKSLRAIAWSDGVLEEDEQLFLERLIRKLGLSPSHHDLAHFWKKPEGTTPVDADAFIPDEKDHFSRLFILSKAIEMSYEDGNYSAQEQDKIGRWAQQWGITPNDLADIEAQIKSANMDKDPFQ